MKNNNNAVRPNAAKETAEEVAARKDSAIEQIMWERNTALQQLRDHYHVGLGEVQNPLMKALDKTDMPLLFEEKEALCAIERELIANNRNNAADYLEGVVNFLEAILDAAEEKGLFETPEYDLDAGRFLDDRYNVKV